MREQPGPDPSHDHSEHGMRALLIVFGPWVAGGLLVFCAGAALGLALQPGDERSAALVFVLGVLPCSTVVAWVIAGQSWYGAIELDDDADLDDELDDDELDDDELDDDELDDDELDLEGGEDWWHMPELGVVKWLLVGAVTLAAYVQLVLGDVPAADPLRYASFGLVAASTLLWFSVALFERPRWLLPGEFRHAARDDAAGPLNVDAWAARRGKTPNGRDPNAR